MTRELSYVQTTLRSSEQLTPHLRRIVLGGDALYRWESSGVPDEAALLVIPDASGSVDVPAEHNGHDYSRCRWYTVRRFDAERAELTIDVVGHDVGLATRWARRARPGDAIGISSVRSWYDRPANAPWQLLLGDITAVPAIGRILEERSDVIPTVVRIEIADARDEVQLPVRDNVSVEWIHNAGESRLGELVRTADVPAGDGYTFVAGEAAATRDVRRHLRHERGLTPASYSVIGYWTARSEDFNRRLEQSGIDLAAIYEAGEAAGKDEEELADEVDRQLVAAGL
ncbi:siderophore-interacting protein [Solicola gregarius]|uniref:Siderophore-interacting protein n=1 Tax=Solicola gregarius TaxID=2908642 RepID=A0AA46TFQ4_9ACTN|nr:siderophore-interacting protein [Solicola gregarius]UYM04353.1 siderophore-interacting protein [Solicola gregarius]